MTVEKRITNLEKIMWGVNAGLVLGLITRLITANEIPTAQEVQKGFVAPSRLEVQLQDNDRNGEDETILMVDETPYLLREIDGKPVLSAYDIKPAEIVPKDNNYGK
jgi:hypothetical protein